MVTLLYNEYNLHNRGSNFSVIWREWKKFFDQESTNHGTNTESLDRHFEIPKTN